MTTAEPSARRGRAWHLATPAALAALLLVGLFIAGAFAALVLGHTASMGLPLDDSYIYLTYARQLGRGELFSYVPGGGYSAGATSAVWPLLLAPFWALGARGHALVWVSYALCAALYALTAVGVWHVVRKVADAPAAAAAALWLLALAPFAWTCLSGMEVALASSLLVAMIALLLSQPAAGPPSWRLAVVLAAASLSRPEAMALVVGVVVVAAVARLRTRSYPAAAAWLAPLAAPAAWLLANKLWAGNALPNTGVAKSHFYQPGFDLTYWWDMLLTTSARMAHGLFVDEKSPFSWPSLVLVAWVVGAYRILRWARREQRYLVGLVIALAPAAMAMAVVASSGMWSFQNYRYITPAFALLAVSVGAALAAPGWLLRWRRGRLVWSLALALGAGLYARAAWPRLVADARLFAQGAIDTNTQVVAIGQHLRAHLPAARVMLHDAGAIAYYGEGHVHDMLGLVTNRQAGVANHGPGSRLEFLEELAPAARPTHFAYYPSWLGAPEFFGEVLLETPLGPALEPRRLVGGGNMQLLTARWELAGKGEQPLAPHPGWRVVDRVDVASLASERAHAWRGELGRRKLGDPTARWSLVGRHQAGPGPLMLDGGRTIRGGRERFTLRLDARRPTRLLLRTGGPAAPPWHERLPAPVALTLHEDGGADRALGTVTLPVPDGPFVELAFELPAGVTAVRSLAALPYRSFHWFALQPE
ncbi:MAG: hypothetical protein IPI49_16960 [Myxococcales bacterium]|nr:hypothetical protein [Myxococcales bacterium]